MTSKKLLVTSLVFSLLISSCNNKEEKAKEVTTSATTSSTTQTTPTSSSTSSDPYDKAVVSFKVNDTLANTKKGAANDGDAQLGTYTHVTKFLNLGLMGDVSSRPHRGWLNFGIKDFKFEPATYTITNENNASFTRYETANAGGSSDFSANSNAVNAGTEFTLTITKIEKDATAEFGNPYLASGTFKAKMYNKVYTMKRDSKVELMITEGTFENVSIVGKPKE
ncbi:MAG: hypothetical protein KA319_00050 [Ferruginibacter sp.]|nr:hypothetical protein [Ferruginibacter sp.]